MKLRRITIKGFRGSLPELDLRLDGKSLCLLGENGHGKTTIVDGAELWATGDLEAYHRAGVGLDAAVHVKADEARITCVVDGYPPLTRTLKGRKTSELVPQGPIAAGVLPPAIPVLRHRTMAAFMGQSAGEKLKALLDLVGLSELTDFRATTVTAANSLAREADNDERKVEGEQRVLALETGDATIIEMGENLRREARLSEAISDEGALLAYELTARPPPAQPDRLALVADLARALQELDQEAVTEFNAVVADLATAQASALETLAREGVRVLDVWTENRCPLCLQTKPRSELVAELAERVNEFAQQTAALRASELRLEKYREQLDAVGRAVRALEEAAPEGGWPAALLSTRSALDAVSMAAREGARGRRTIELPSLHGITDAIEPLREAALAAGDAARPLAALAGLVRLQDQVRRLRLAEATAAASRARAEAMAAFRDLTEKTTRDVIERVLDEIGQRTADYYGRLVRTSLYDNVRLAYQDGRPGGVEFELTFNQKHRVSPPARVLSESQLNALGLALFLAQLKSHDEQPWRTLILDDVVNSFDGHRRGALAQLLDEEFGDWQILLFTHDPVFAGHNARLQARGWLRHEIVAWTAEGGIVIGESDPLRQLRKQLEAGVAATQLGGPARRALEHELSKPCEKLRLRVPYHRDPHYTAADFLDALKASAKKTELNLPVLARISAASYFVNFTAHDRAAQGSVSSEELRELVDHLDELREALRCSSCGEHVWYAASDGGRRHQCRCSALAMSA